MATYIQGASQLPQWLAYTDSLPWVKGSLDDSSNRAFLRGASFGIDPQTASDEIARRITDSGERLRPAKLVSQCQSAYSRVAVGAQGVLQPSAGIKWPPVDWNALSWLAVNGPGICDVWQCSPLRWEDDAAHSEEIIDAMFPGNPWLCTAIDNYSFATRRRECWRGRLSRRSLIVPSPMTAPWGRTKEGEPSQHSLEAVAPRRTYLVIEHDFDAARPDQLDVGQWLRDGREIVDVCSAVHNHLASILPLVCVVWSGNKSLHGYYLVAGRPEPEQLAFMCEAIRLGACLSHWTNRAQFARIPDGTRADNGERQTCFYFNPGNCCNP